MNEVITAANCITAIGHDGKTSAASFFAGISRIAYDRHIPDVWGKPVKSSRIEGLVEDIKDEKHFMTFIVQKCLEDLCRDYFKDQSQVDHIFLFLGLPQHDRPGPDLDLNDVLESCVTPYARTLFVETKKTGNAAVVHGMIRCREILSEDPHALCIIGGTDSLLSKDTLAWFEKEERLKSDSMGRELGLIPSQAAGFFIVESLHAAQDRKRDTRLSVNGLGLEMEPAPYLSDAPSKAIGLTQAIRISLTQANSSPEIVDAVYCDLNGEFYRSKEWGMANLRCFDKGNPDKKLFHPADCMGAIGAASLPVFVTMAFERSKTEASEKTVCLFVSDDHGERGALILQKS